MSLSLVPGDYYWVTDTEDSYIPAEYKATATNGALELETYLSKKRIMRASGDVRFPVIPPLSSLQNPVDDLVQCNDISEPYILWSLRDRFASGKFYSSIGSIIIAMNPYRVVPEMYSQEVMNTYLTAPALERCPPHVWKSTRDAFDRLQQTGRRQAMIISGESGAGKTETTKKCLQFISSIAASKQNSSTEVPIEDKVLGSNPLLESFGNAKTSRNNNSSRFGKLLQVNFQMFNGRLRLLGANITQYLLEKSRVVNQSKGERNYHIFYQICANHAAGAADASAYKYLNESGCISIDGIDDSIEFQDTLKSFDSLQFPQDMRDTVLSCLVAILHIGNIAFENDEEGFSQVNASSTSEIIKVCSLLGLDASTFGSALCVKSQSISGSITNIPLTVTQAIDSRNAFAKEIYGRIFSYIVYGANQSLSGMYVDSSLSIGLLDIFGFEILALNSLEQLAINYCNERLHNHFITYVICKEQDLYIAEEINYTSVAPKLNDDVISLIGGKGGIFSLLDDEAKILKGSDITFLGKLEKGQPKSSPTTRFYKDVKTAKSQFTVRHFAGDVRYESAGFLEKNKDKLYDHMDDLLNSTTNEKFADLMAAAARKDPTSSASEGGSGPDTPSSKKKANLVTLLGRFQSQLQELMDVLGGSEPHFIKCIKPNSIKSSTKVEPPLVLEQLRYSGILEAVVVRKQGFPTRRTHEDFRGDYWALVKLNRMDVKQNPPVEVCRIIIKRLQSRPGAQYCNMHVGKSLVFFRPEVLSLLDDERIVLTERLAIKGQAVWRMYTEKKRVRKLAQARALLREAITLGSENNRGNISVIGSLESNIENCATTLKLRIIEIKNGRVLLQRLRTVEITFTSLDFALSLQAKSKYEDIFEEYDNATQVIASLDELQVHHESRKLLEDKIETLQERAVFLGKFRKAIISRDDILMAELTKECLSLIQKYGIFCDKEMVTSKALLAEVKSEHETLDAVLKEVNDLQKADMRTGDVANSQAILRSSSAKLQPLLQALKSTFSASVVSVHTAESIEYTLELKKNWILKDWPTLSNFGQKLSSSRQHILTIISNGLTKQYESRLNLLLPILTAEVDGVVSGIDLYVSLPIITDAISRAKELNVHATPAEFAAQFKIMKDCYISLTEIGAYGKMITMMMARIRNLIMTTESVLSRKFDLAFYLQETSKATEMRRKLQHELVEICQSLKLNFVDVNEEAEVQLISEYFQSSESYSEDIDTSKIMCTNLEEEYKMVVSVIEKSVTNIHTRVIADFIEFQCIKACSFGKAIDKFGEVIVAEASGKAIAKVFEIIDVLGYKTNDKFVNSSSIYQLSMILLSLRKMLIKKSYSEIFDFFTSGGYRSAVELINSIGDSNFTYRCALEIDAVVREGRNTYLVESLTDCIVSGKIKGTLGCVDIAAVDLTGLSKQLDHVADCLSVEPTGITSELENLSTFALLLLDCRKAFKDADPEQKIVSYNSLKTAESIPDIAMDEFTFIGYEIQYLTAKFMIEGVLRKHENDDVSYFTTSTDASGIVLTSPEPCALNMKYLAVEAGDEDAGLGLIESIDEAQLVKTRFDDLQDNTSEARNEFMMYMRAANMIYGIRTAVVRMNWVEACKIYDANPLATLGPACDFVRKEVESCIDSVHEIMLIELLKKYLRYDQASGSIGLIDFNNSCKIHNLEDVISTCNRRNSKSEKLQTMVDASIFILTARKHLRASYWSALKSHLESKTVFVSKLCSEEIERIYHEIRNNDMMNELSSTIIEEEIKGVPGSIIIPPTNKLEAFVHDEQNQNHTSLSDLTNKMISMAVNLYRVRDTTKVSFSDNVNFEDLLHTYASSIQDVEISLNNFADAQKLNGAFIESELEKKLELMTIIQREFDFLHAHSKHHATELAFLSSMSHTFMSEKIIGKVSKRLIDLKGLTEAYEMKTDLDGDGIPLTARLNLISTAGKLQLDIRTALLNEDWDMFDSLVKTADETKHDSILPPEYRTEMLLMSLESENRRIVTGIQNALRKGNLVITPNDTIDTILSVVHCGVLSSFTKESMGIVPKSKLADDLMNSIEVTIHLRKLVREGNVDWNYIKVKTDEVLERAVSGRTAEDDDDMPQVHACILPEIEEFRKTAEDQLLFSALCDSLVVSKPNGFPGAIDLSKVDDKRLADICLGVGQSHAHLYQTIQLLAIAQRIRELRSFLMHIREAENKTDQVLWRQVGRTIEAILEEKSSISPNVHVGFEICKEEILLTAREYHINEVRNKILISIKHAGAIYQKQQQIARVNMRASFIEKTSEDHLSTKDLSEIISFIDNCKNSDIGDSIPLRDLANCCRVLRKIRNDVIDKNWEALKRIELAELNDLNVLPEAKQELMWAKREDNNHSVLQAIEGALKNIQHAENDPFQQKLESAISYAKGQDIHNEEIKRLIECASHMKELRRFLLRREKEYIPQVEHELRWFESNIKKCPDYLKTEVKESRKNHDNYVMTTNILHALSTGKAQGVIGNMNTQTIEYEHLERAIFQAKALSVKSGDLEALIKVAEAVFGLRVAQKSKKIALVENALKQLKGEDDLHPTIIEEVATARADVENASVLAILKKATSSFVDSPNRAIDECLFDVDDVVPLSNSSDVDEKDLSLDRYNISAMSKALADAENYGIYSRDAKRLHKSIVILHAIRDAKSRRDWVEIKEILEAVKEESTSSDHRLDPLADDEITVTEIQLDMQEASKGVLITLQSGWADCSNGIVNHSTIEVRNLEKQIDRLESCLIDIHGGQLDFEEIATTVKPTFSLSKVDPTSSPGKPQTPSPQKVNRRQSVRMSFGTKQSKIESIAKTADSVASREERTKSYVFALLKAAKVVLRVRHLIQDGDFESASIVAEAHAKDPKTHPKVIEELALYETEIGRALKIVKLSKDIRGGMRNGNTDAIVESLKEVYKSQTCDLGLLRVTARAVGFYSDLTRKQIDLLQLRSNFDASKIQQMIDCYSKHKLPKGIIEFAKSRITRLSKLSITINELTRDVHGYIHGDYYYEFLIEVARDLSLLQHPYIRRLRILRRLPDLAQCVATITGASGCGAASVVAAYTMQLHSSYCQDQLSKDPNTLLSIYDNWRSPVEYFYGSSIVPESEMLNQMLMYAPGAIPTSLTKLPPQLCALSVWVFSRYICCIDRALSLHPEVLLRDLINLGRSCISMRDEIFAQHLKMIRGRRDDEEAKTRIYFSLAGCLHHFPPSEKFESYMQAVLMIENKSDTDFTFFSSLALQLLHESVFKYGYNIKLTATYDDSLETMKEWLTSKDYLEKRVVNKPTLRTSFLSPQSIRGTRENWSIRFFQLSRGQVAITFQDFMANIFSQAVDVKDREILFLLICGTWPSRRLALVREYAADKVLYKYEDIQSESRSTMRRKVLQAVCSPPIASSVFEDRTAACNTFWRVYVQALKTSASKDNVFLFEDYRDIILCGMEWIKVNGNDLLVKGAKAAAARGMMKELI